MPLAKNDFNKFFYEINGFEPFPWQGRYCKEILTKGPSSIKNITSFTGTGKTNCIDAHIFALAYEGSLVEKGDIKFSERKIARRLYWVIDRRLTTDSTYEHAKKIVDKINSASDGILLDIKNALMFLGDGAPIVAAKLRGGVKSDKGVFESPVQTGIIVSTVDMVGSKSLFRGYGTSDKVKPIHAALFANDAAVYLDEAHCSKAFSETLSNILRLKELAEKPIRTPFYVISLSATMLRSEGGFTISDEDTSNPVLKKRLCCEKLFKLISVKPEHINLMLDSEIKRLLKDDAKSIAIVVNSSRFARILHRGILKRNKNNEFDLCLLTGRNRPSVRDNVVDNSKDRICAGRDRALFSDSSPIVVIATQCIEVGADFDFDAMIIESCSYDALVQRVGRLNRLGEINKKFISVLFSITGKNDHIYRNSSKNTWKWLLENAEKGKKINLGILHIQSLLPKDNQEKENLLKLLTVAGQPAEVLHPDYMNMFAMTSPIPAQSPAPSNFLHGASSGNSDIAVVWRADILDGGSAENWIRNVSFSKPCSAEAASVPIGSFKLFLKTSRKNEIDYSDAEWVTDEDHYSGRDNRLTGARPFLIWNSDDPDKSVLSTDPNDISVGDAIIIPASYGGCDEFGWDEKSRAIVEDAFEQSRLNSDYLKVLRVHRNRKLWDDMDSHVNEVISVYNDAGKDEAIKYVTLLFEKLLETAVPLEKWVKKYIDKITISKIRDILFYEDNLGFVVIPVGEDISNEGTMCSEGKEISLKSHSDEVATLAKRYAVMCGLSEDICNVIEFSAGGHDCGKAYVVFQCIYRNERRKAAVAGKTIIAKSINNLSGVEYAILAKDLLHKKGIRHEVISYALVSSRENEFSKTVSDIELAEHLILSHHGYCRPFPPLIDETNHVEFTYEYRGLKMDSSKYPDMQKIGESMPNRFFVVTRRYGWWGGAYLEAILRLADWACSKKITEAANG